MKDTIRALFWPVAIVAALYGWMRWQERNELNETRGSLLVQSASPTWMAKIQQRVNEENS